MGRGAFWKANPRKVQRRFRSRPFSCGMALWMTGLTLSWPPTLLDRVEITAYTLGSSRWLEEVEVVDSDDFIQLPVLSPQLLSLLSAR